LKCPNPRFEQGKFEHLIANNGYAAGLAAGYVEEGEDDAKEESTPAKTKADDGAARRNAAADLDRPVGDWAVYDYYITSLGHRKVLAWMGIMVFYSMLLRFPGKVSLTPP